MNVKSKNTMVPIYLDYHSTTPVDLRVANIMLYYMTTAFGNASSIDHTYGDEAEAAVSKAATHLAEIVGASPKEVIFTSGATESINLAIQGSIFSDTSSKPKHRIAVLPVEHKAVLDTCHAQAKKGLAEMVILRVDSMGRLDIEHLEVTVQGGIKKTSNMKSHVISTKTSLDWIYTG